MYLLTTFNTYHSTLQGYTSRCLIYKKGEFKRQNTKGKTGETPSPRRSRPSSPRRAVAGSDRTVRVSQAGQSEGC